MQEAKEVSNSRLLELNVESQGKWIKLRNEELHNLCYLWGCDTVQGFNKPVRNNSEIHKRHYPRRETLKPQIHNLLSSNIGD